MKKIKIKKWVARTTTRSQGVDVKGVELAKNSIKKLSFILQSNSLYWRAGFKLCSPNTSDLPIRNQESLLFHLGSKESQNNIRVTVYINGELKLDKTLQYIKDNKLKISFEVNNKNFIICYINGHPEFQGKVDSAILKKIYLLAWGDSQDNKFRQYEVKFKNIIGNYRNFQDSSQQKSISNNEKLWKEEVPWPIAYTIWFLKLISTCFKKGNKLKSLVVFVIIFLIVALFIIVKDKPAFSYVLLSESFEAENEQFPMKLNFWFNGNIRNTFESKKSLERIDYVIWKNKMLGSVYSGGYVMGKIYDEGADDDRKEIRLPILFEPNEVKHLGISLQITIENRDELNRQFPYRCFGVYCHFENNVELQFKDESDNLFDEQGKLISSDVIDSWWLLPNNRNFKDRSLAKLDILKNIIVWKIQRYLYLIK